MSGQPYRYAKDVEDFRNDYMATLGLRANLDDVNLQANKVFKDTGSLPPVSTMKETRTTAEILLDIEKLKISVIAELKGVVTPQMALSMIQQIQSSPYNADGSFMSWFAQNLPELVIQMKKKYKFGIVGNENDIIKMITFLTSIFAKTKEMGSTVKSAFDRPTSSLNTGISDGDLTKLLEEYNRIQYKLVSNATLNRGSLDLITKIRDQFDSMSLVLDTQRFTLIKAIFANASTNISGGNQLMLNYTGYQTLNEYIDSLPSKSGLATLLDQLDRSAKNKNDDLSDQILTNLSSLLPTTTYSNSVVKIMEDMINPPGPRPAPAFVPMPAPPPVPPGYVAPNYVPPGGPGRPLPRPPPPPSGNPPPGGRQRIPPPPPGNPPGPPPLPPTSGNGVKRRPGRPKGKGIVKPISERIEHTQGIKQGHTHVPFGKYILDKVKLDCDLVYFKHEKGYGVKGYPTTKVSKKLGQLLRTIIGGGVPKFDELEGLSDSEKEYLHKVATKVGIMDKISIPVPSKDKMEQDVHQFEVMKGELLSGNDSPELVKKFKLILIRLSRNGTIPKREAMELMEDLIHLGY